APPRRPPSPAATSRTRRGSTTNAVHRPPRRLPRVVRGARAEGGLVRDHARVATDLLRPLGVTEQVRVVALLPDEIAAGRRARKGRRRDAEPARVVLAAVAGPQLLLLGELLVLEEQAARFVQHAPRLADTLKGPGQAIGALQPVRR